MAPHCKDIKLYLSTLLPSASTVITKEELAEKGTDFLIWATSVWLQSHTLLCVPLAA